MKSWAIMLVFVVLTIPAVAGDQSFAIAMPAEFDRKQGYEEKSDSTFLVEWVKGSETVHNWTQLLTVTLHRGLEGVTAEEFAQGSVEVIQKQYKGDAQIYLLEKKGNAVFLSWGLMNSRLYPDQQTLMRVYPVPGAIVTVQYARKGPRLPQSEVSAQRKLLDLIVVVKPK